MMLSRSVPIGLTFSATAHPDDGLPKSATFPVDSENAIPTPTDSRRASREVPPTDAPVQLVDVSTPVRTPVPTPAPPRPAAPSGAPIVPPKPQPTTPTTSSTNPFINRAKSHDPQPAAAAVRARNTQSPLPPLPPRKPAAPPPPPPRHGSLVSPNTASFPASGAGPAFAFTRAVVLRLARLHSRACRRSSRAIPRFLLAPTPSLQVAGPVFAPRCADG